MLHQIKRTVGRYLINLPGWHTTRKIVVIESDDWGSIRMPSREALDRLLAKNIQFKLEWGFDKVDTLASPEDLSKLFEVLTSFKDKNGGHPVITADTIVANPDFEKIKASGYKEYFYEPFTETLKKYPRHSHSFELWKQGMAAKVFHPQFHGREHLNVPFWLEKLQNNDPDVIHCFQEKVFSCRLKNGSREKFLSTYNYEKTEDLAFMQQSIIEGTDLFEKIFGFRSRSMIAPSYTWDDPLEETAQECGIKYLQGGIFQSHSQHTRNTTGKKSSFHYNGQKNRFGQIYLSRNCIFEPTAAPDPQVIENCMSQIAIAFKLFKPAVISSHRLNFIGDLVPENRDNNLILLSRLLSLLLKKYPDVEFMTSDQLGDLITLIDHRL